jgi:hypothetical protein
VSPRVSGDWLLLRDRRRASWVLVLPAQRFIEQPRPDSPVRLALDRAQDRADLAPLEQCWIGAMIAVWFGSLFWVLWHLLACD